MFVSSTIYVYAQHKIILTYESKKKNKKLCSIKRKDIMISFLNLTSYPRIKMVFSKMVKENEISYITIT